MKQAGDNDEDEDATAGHHHDDSDVSHVSDQSCY